MHSLRVLPGQTGLPSLMEFSSSSVSYFVILFDNFSDRFHVVVFATTAIAELLVNHDHGSMTVAVWLQPQTFNRHFSKYNYK